MVMKIKINDLSFPFKKKEQKKQSKPNRDRKW